MRAGTPVTLIAALSLAAAISAAPAGAEPTVTATADRSGNTATVTGIATFPEITEPQSVDGLRGQGAVGLRTQDAAGINLVDGLIVPLPDGAGLRFIWQLDDLPYAETPAAPDAPDDLPDEVPDVETPEPVSAAAPPPEGVRYTWAMTVGGEEFQLQAKRTNIASTTTVEDPVGHARHLQTGDDWFQLRGACETEYLGTPAAGCYHLAFLDGGFDHDNDQVFIDWPFGLRDNIGRIVSEELRPGATLRAHDTAGMSIAASHQAVASHTAVSTWLNSWLDYHVGPMVQFGVGPSTRAPHQVSYGTTATLNADGTFSGTVTGFDATNDTVFVRACNGMDCAFAVADAG